MKEKKPKNVEILDIEETVTEDEGIVCGDVLETSDDDKLSNLIEQKDKQIAELTDKWQRTMAEFDNFRKRTQREKSSMYNDGVFDTITNLLPVIDNFERALASDSDKDSGFFKGIDMIYKQLQGYLKEAGVEEIPGTGESFNPSIHYAVTHVEDASYGENMVIDTLCKGYKLKEKVIRPTMVKVAN